MNNEGTSGCIDPSKLAIAIFGAIFGTLLLCTGFAFAIWYLVRNHQLADKFFILDSTRKQQRNKDEEEAGPAASLDEVDNGFHLEKEKMDLAHLSVAVEMEEIPLEKSLDKFGLLGKKEEKEAIMPEGNVELDGGEKEEMVEKEEKEMPISPKLVANEKIAARESGIPVKSTTRNGIILDPMAIEKPSKGEERCRFAKNGAALAQQHQRAPSQESEAPPEMVERLRMLSAEQFGMLDTNRRRLEQERRQLRELGVI